MKGLKTGDTLPDFRLKNQKGEITESRSYIGKALVLFFYPKNNTSICTDQACSIRNQHEEFNDLEATVVGISADSVRSHEKFAARYKLKYDLLSDPKNTVRKLFGVPKSMFGLGEGRVTYVFNKEGLLVEVYNATFESKGHVKKALEVLKRKNI